MTDNLLDLLEFDDGDIDIFIRDHRCALGGCWLVAQPRPGRKWNAICRTHGPIMAHNYVKASVAEHNEQGRMSAERDLQPERPKRTPEEILKDLGF